MQLSQDDHRQHDNAQERSVVVKYKAAGRYRASYRNR